MLSPPVIVNEFSMPRVGKGQNGDSSAKYSDGIHHESPKSSIFAIKKLPKVLFQHDPNLIEPLWYALT